MTNNWPPPPPRRNFMDIHDGYLPPVREGKYDAAALILAKKILRFIGTALLITLMLTILL